LFAQWAIATDQDLGVRQLPSRQRDCLKQEAMSFDLIQSAGYAEDELIVVDSEYLAKALLVLLGGGIDAVVNDCGAQTGIAAQPTPLTSCGIADVDGEGRRPHRDCLQAPIGDPSQWRACRRCDGEMIAIERLKVAEPPRGQGGGFRAVDV